MKKKDERRKRKRKQGNTCTRKSNSTKSERLMTQVDQVTKHSDRQQSTIKQQL